MITPKISIEHVYPPIPDRRFDYRAYYEDDDPSPEGNAPNGWGRTEFSAVADLIDNHPRPDVFCGERGR